MILYCTSCGAPQDLPITVTDLVAAKNSGKCIQSALPQLSAAELEMCISGTCGACWESLFAGMDDREEED